MTRCIGLDPGSRRIGVAVGDSETAIAFPRPPIRHRSAAADVEAIASVAREEGAELVVVGLPRNMDGSEGPQAAAARAFGERLAAIGLNVVFHDERLTSWAAAEQMAAEGRRPHRSTGELDSAAAAVMLQDYLDARARPGDVLESQ
jgi:putative Holliday junction resolvase